MWVKSYTFSKGFAVVKGSGNAKERVRFFMAMKQEIINSWTPKIRRSGVQRKRSNCIFVKGWQRLLNCLIFVLLKRVKKLTGRELTAKVDCPEMRRILRLLKKHSRL
jgi:hypothetical protein